MASIPVSELKSFANEMRDYRIDILYDKNRKEWMVMVKDKGVDSNFVLSPIVQPDGTNTQLHYFALMQSKNLSKCFVVQAAPSLYYFIPKECEQVYREAFDYKMELDRKGLIPDVDAERRNELVNNLISEADTVSEDPVFRIDSFKFIAVQYTAQVETTMQLGGRAYLVKPSDWVVSSDVGLFVVCEDATFRKSFAAVSERARNFLLGKF